MGVSQGTTWCSLGSKSRAYLGREATYNRKDSKLQG